MKVQIFGNKISASRLFLILRNVRRFSLGLSLFRSDFGAKFQPAVLIKKAFDFLIKKKKTCDKNRKIF